MLNKILNIKTALIGLWVVVVILSFYLNFCKLDTCLKYFNVPFKDLLNILFLSLVVYFFVEYKNDERSRKQSLDWVIKKVISRLEDPRMYKITQGSDVDHIRITQRSINNEIDIIEDCAVVFCYEEEAKYCQDAFKEYWAFLSDHLSDTEYLAKSETTLFNIISNIIWRLEVIAVNLHK